MAPRNGGAIRHSPASPVYRSPGAAPAEGSGAAAQDFSCCSWRPKVSGRCLQGVPAASRHGPACRTHRALLAAPSEQSGAVTKSSAPSRGGQRNLRVLAGSLSHCQPWSSWPQEMSFWGRSRSGVPGRYPGMQLVCKVSNSSGNCPAAQVACQPGRHFLSGGNSHAGDRPGRNRPLLPRSGVNCVQTPICLGPPLC